MHKQQQQQQQNVLRLTSNPTQSQGPQLIRMPNGTIIPLQSTNVIMGQQPTVIPIQRPFIQNTSVPGLTIQNQRPQNITSLQVPRVQIVAANRPMIANRVQPNVATAIQQPRQIITQVSGHQLAHTEPTMMTKLPVVVTQAVARMPSPVLFAQPSSPHPQVVLKQDQPVEATPAPTNQQNLNSPEVESNANKCMAFLRHLIVEASKESKEKGQLMNGLVNQLVLGKLTEEQFVDVLKQSGNKRITDAIVPVLKNNITEIRRILANKAAANSASAKSESEKPVVVQSTPLAGQTINPSGVVTPNAHQGQVLVQIQSAAKGLVTLKGGLKPPLQPIVLNTPNLQNYQTLQNSATVPAVHLLKGVKRKHEVVENDEDINDVTAMAGVNLTEEAVTVVPTLTFNSLKDKKIVEESYLDLDRLKTRMEKLLQKQGLAFSPEALLFLSHAAREMHANVLTSLGRYAAHRLTIYKNDDMYSTTSNVRRQIKFVQEIKQVSARRGDSKSAGAIEKKEVTKGSINIDESNNAALQAIGSKRSKISSTGLTFRSSLLTQPRSKRASMKDMIYAIEDYRYLKSNKAYYKACMTK